ncbi:MAG: hypothetical protein QXF85_00540 [Candidatus Micrarchaeaceae archaeon]
MKGHSILPLLLCGFLIAGIANAQYWFQSGARAGNSAAQNNGAMASIETIYQRPAASGSMAFWVGEDLQNGAFIQIGYTIENQSGYYPTNCTISGCSSTVYLTAGRPAWFYEYFLPSDNSTFLGAIGPDGSAGVNGTFNTYGFYSLGNIWHLLFNGKQVGAVNLGTDSSGPNPPVAIGELANSSGITSYMLPVIFSNLSAYKYDTFLPVENAYGVVSYGVGSMTNVQNPYGVEEIGNRVNYFEVGSKLPTDVNGTQLWHLGYFLKISSQYSALNSSVEYDAYSQVSISAPQVLYLNSTAREVFSHWTGTGIGSYTGTSNSTVISMNSNITEYAAYTLEYFVNVTSNFSTYGTGWYSAGSIAKYGVSKTSIYISNNSRFIFTSWNSGSTAANGTVIVNAPMHFVAEYTHQLLISAATQYGNVSGAGWFAQGSRDNITVLNPIENISNNERYAFVSWSNGSRQQTLSIIVNKPVSIDALFSKEYKVNIIGRNSSGAPIDVVYYIANGTRINSTSYLEQGTYQISTAFYKGTSINTSYVLSVTSPETVNITLPVYSLSISTKDIFGLPVNATLRIKFENGTSVLRSSGAFGEIYLSNIPYGYASGDASYLFSEGFSTQQGRPVSLIFVSPSSLLVVIVLVLICILLPVWIWKERNMKSS